MIDTLVRLLPKAENRPILAELGLIEQRSPRAGEQRSKGAEERRSPSPQHLSTVCAGDVASALECG